MLALYHRPLRASLVCLCLTNSTPSFAAEPAAKAASAKPAPAQLPPSLPGDALLADYFRHQTKLLQENCLAEIQTLKDWEAKRGEYRRQMLFMLGLDPFPARTALKAEITGKVDEAEFTVENIVFQSLPGLYVTGNFYLPKKIEKPLPTILYVSGHAPMKFDGISYGNKTKYSHHGIWFAKRGYACLIIDTIHLGEIEGMHRGTHHFNTWWWLNRGYTPAGVEAWNCVRALDYLETRPEVDSARFGVTGRSGGGAYSFWISAIDDRIKVSVPVAGITDLQNHVVDHCIEGHCDCMYVQNAHGWDYAMVAALTAPRPMLIANTDADTIFPLDGVARIFQQTRRIYKLHRAADKIGLAIGPGPHKDTPEVRSPAFIWFDKHLKGIETDGSLPELIKVDHTLLRVLKEIPADQKNTAIQETFVAAASPPVVPADHAAWDAQRASWMDTLATKSFRAWPANPVPLNVRRTLQFDSQGLSFAAYEFTSQEHVPMVFYVLRPAGEATAKRLVLNFPEQPEWESTLAMLKTLLPAGERHAELDSLALPADRKELAEKLLQKQRSWVLSNDCAIGWVAVRGIGPTQISYTGNKRIHVLRRYMLLGQTLDGQRAWDVRRAVQAIRTQATLKGLPLTLSAEGVQAGVVLYASLFEPDIAQLELTNLPSTHREGPIFFNVQRFLEMPQAVAMAAERSRLVLHQSDEAHWNFPIAVIGNLGLPAGQLRVNKDRQR